MEISASAVQSIFYSVNLLILEFPKDKVGAGSDHNSMKTQTNKHVFSQHSVHRSLSAMVSGVTFSPQGKYLDWRGILVTCPGAEGAG